MILANKKVMLSISEPWDLSREIIGEIINEFFKNGDLYFAILDSITNDIYYVHTRYISDSLLSIASGNPVIVNISVPDVERKTSIEIDPFYNMKGYGIGSIQLYLT